MAALIIILLMLLFHLAKEGLNLFEDHDKNDRDGKWEKMQKIAKEVESKGVQW